MELITVAISSASNRSVHKLGWSLKSNISFNTATLANSSDDTVEW